MAALKNVRHEKFAQCLAQGMSQRKAYRAAFPSAEKWKNETVDSRASDLKKNSKVLVRLGELQQLASDEAVMDVIKRKKWLTSIIESEEESMKDKLRAADMLNKMEGSYIAKDQLDITEQQARIDKLKAETARIKGEDPDADQQDDGFLEALKGKVAEVWEDE